MFSGLVLFAAGFAGLDAEVASGQTLRSAQPALITKAVNETDLVTLQGTVHPLATPAADRGAMPRSTAASRMLLLLKRSPEQEALLHSTLQSLHDSNSPNFHKWLTPEQFGARWGAADSDIATVTAWLQSHGFEVKGATAGKTAIEFSGTTGMIGEAFHTEIHQYLVGGVMHHANATDPQIPAALAPVVAGIATLNDFHPKSMAQAGPRGIYNQKTHSFRPDFTSTITSGDFLYVGPADAATIYNIPNPALNPVATGTKYDGTGVKIAIVGDSNISTAQNANYRSLFGLGANAPGVVVDGSINPGENGDAVEAYLDTEVASGIAPGAKIYLYTAANTSADSGLNLAIVRAINDNIADILNVSFGECEAALAYPGNQFYAQEWEQAAAQGISVTVSSGDSGSAGCDDENTETVAKYGLHVNGIASPEFDIAVGGTDFAALAGPDGSGANFNNYVAQLNANGTLRSALGFIPEVPWNDTSLNYPPGPISGTVPEPSASRNIVAGGGGRSNCSEGYFGGNGLPYCVRGYLKPSYQTALTPQDDERDLPDVSLFSGNGVYSAAWGICTDQDKSGGGESIADCTPGADGLSADEFYIYGVGGTSASSPAFAGILALLKQATGDRLGQANYALYNLARTKPETFHDVVAGNNSVPCMSGTADCNKNGKSAYFLKGYDTAVGYDLASGLGSVDVAALIKNWANVGLSSTTTTLSLTPTSIEHGGEVTAAANVAAKDEGSPTGDIAISAYANPPSFKEGASIGYYPLIESSAGTGSTGSLSINHLPGGTYKVVATYGGSGTYSGSTSTPIEVTVAPEPSKTSILVSPYDPATSSPSSTIQYGYYLGFAASPYGIHSPVVDGNVQPDGTPTGTIAFAVDGRTLNNAHLSLEGLASYRMGTGNLLKAGQHTITASYSGDSSFEPSTGSEVVEIIKAPTRLSMTSSATASAGKSVTFTVKLASDSLGFAPTGEVELKTGSTVLGKANLVGVGASNSIAATGAATISVSEFPLGNSVVEAVYVGDANYEAANSNEITITGKPYFLIRGSSVELPSEHSTAAPYLPTQSYSGYKGTINFTCKLVGSYTESAPPECALYPTASVSLGANATAAPQILIFGKGTKLPKGVEIGSNQGPGSDRNAGGKGLGVGLGVMALASCFLFGAPARGRRWKALVSVFLLLAALSSFSACSSQQKMISVGRYTFTVTGTDSVDPTNTTTATIKVTVL